MKGAVVVAATALAGALWLAWPAEPVAPPVSAPAPRPAIGVGPGAVPAQGMPWMSALPDPGPLPPAWHSMAHARLHGDPRMPPLHVPVRDDTGPSPAQLADPDAYRAFEQGRDARLLNAYAAAVDVELPRLRADVARARASGIAPDQIAKVEAKIARLEKLRLGIVEKGAVAE